MSAKKTQAQFIIDARAAHGDKYEYLSHYQSAVKKIDIFCVECSTVFKQRPNTHLCGAGCPVCAKARMHASRVDARDIAAAKFILRAAAIHGSRYDYSKTIYGKNCEAHVSIVCRDHGEFLISPSNHLKGKGCPSCVKYGFDPAKIAYLYLLLGETPDIGEVVKVGITNVPKSRLAVNRRNDKINWRMARLVRYPDGWLPRRFENILIDYFGAAFMGKERFAHSHENALKIFDIVTRL